MSAYSDFQKYVNDVESSSTYKSWCNAHAADCSAWQTYRTGLLTATPSPAPPAMSTRFGQSLVDVGRMAVDAGLVAPPPPPIVILTAAFTSSSSGLTASFISTSKPGPSGPITGYHWDFGDGATSTAQNPSHLYAAPGSFTVTLTITSPDGTATTSAVVSVTNLAALTAAFTSVVSTLTASFTDHSTPGPSGPITAYHWDFGDGNTSTAASPNHTYAAGGNYSVTLTVTGTAPDGTANVTHTVSVAAAPPPSTGYRPYTPVSSLNQPIPTPAPVHPSSALMISEANHWLLGGTAYDPYKEWIGPRQRGHYWRGDTSVLPKVTLHINWFNGVTACDAGGTAQVPMPTFMAAIAPHNDYDGYIIIVDSTTGDVWEVYRATPPGTPSKNASCNSAQWNCMALRHWVADTTTRSGYSEASGVYGGTSASKIHMTGGLLIPEDFADCFSGSDPGTVIPHVMRISSFCGSKGTTFPRYVLPGRGGDGTQVNGFPAGGRVQLDPSINVSTWPSVNAKPEPWRSGLKKILRTFQQRGAVQVDSDSAPGAGGIDCISAASVAKGIYNGSTGWRFPWDVAGAGWAYNNGIPYDLMPHFRVVNWTVWTGA